MNTNDQVKLDVVICDNARYDIPVGHTNEQIYSTFISLFPKLSGQTLSDSKNDDGTITWTFTKEHS